MKIFTIVSMVAALIFTLQSCNKTESTNTSSNFASTVATNLQTISDNFTPDSLASASTSSSVHDLDENPCTGTNGLIDCQPNLLKLYLSVSKDQLGMVKQIVSEIGTNLGQLDDGASGTVSETGMTINYSKTDSDTWSVTLINNVSSNTAAYVSVDGSAYTLEIDFSEADDDSASVGKYQALVNFTNGNTWDLTATMVGAACSDDDVRAPQNVKIRMEKASGLWKGKAMLYHPRWAEFSPDPTCSSTPSDTNGLNMFSDYVGDNTVAKMNVYMLKRTRAANEITAHPLSDICSEYAICSSGSIGVETPASYPNSACILASNGDATWNTDCSTEAPASDVSSASFGSSSDWIAPSDFYGLDINVGP